MPPPPTLAPSIRVHDCNRAGVRIPSGWESGAAVSVAADVAVPDGRRVARQGAGGHRRGAARRAARDGRRHPGRVGAAPAGLRPRPTAALRAGRADADRRRPPRSHARLAGGDRDRQLRVGAQRQVARGDVARARRDQVPAHAGASRPRRPRGHAEVRLRRRTRRPRAGERTGDRGTGRRRCRWPSCCCARSASRSCRTSSRWVRRAATRRGRRPADLADVDESPVRCFDPGRRRPDDRRDQGRGQGRRLARRRRRGARLRRAGRSRQPRPLGPQARRAARPGGDEHPGGQGRRDRRRVRGRRPARERRPRPDHLGRRRRASTAVAPRSPAASRAASRPASSSSCAPR